MSHRRSLERRLKEREAELQRAYKRLSLLATLTENAIGQMEDPHVIRAFNIALAGIIGADISV